MILSMYILSEKNQVDISRLLLMVLNVVWTHPYPFSSTITQIHFDFKSTRKISREMKLDRIILFCLFIQTF